MRRYAGFWLRVIAYLIDGTIVDAATFLIGGSIGMMGMGWRGGDAYMAVAMGQTLGWLGPLLALLYWAGMESCPTQATLGKMAVGIQVTDLAGRRISFLRALARNLAKVLSALLLGFGFLMVAFTAHKQGLHDLIAGTLVVRKSAAPRPEEPSRLMSGRAPERPTPRTYDDGR